MSGTSDIHVIDKHYGALPLDQLGKPPLCRSVCYHSFTWHSGRHGGLCVHSQTVWNHFTGQKTLPTTS